MKVRNGFVSNSSSSSFIVVGDPPKNLDFMQITNPAILKKIAARCEVPSDIFKDKEVYLTSFIPDCSLLYDDFFDSDNKFEYSSGGVCGDPYEEEDYFEISENVFLFKSDSDDFEVCFSELIAQYSYLILKHFEGKAPDEFSSALSEFTSLAEKEFKAKLKKTYTVRKFEKFLNSSFKKIPKLKDWFEDGLELKEGLLTKFKDS